MKKRSNLIFLSVFIGSVLLCSLILIFIFELIKNGNEGKVHEVSIEANQDMRELSDQEGNDSKEVETEDASSTVENQETNQTQQTEQQAGQQKEENTELQTEEQIKENDNSLVSGVENKLVAVNEGIVKLTIDAAVDEVKVSQGDGEKLEITQIYKNIDKDDIFSVDELNDELIITTEYTDPSLQLPGNDTGRSSTLDIKLPKEFYGELEVANDVGNIYIENELNLEIVDLNSNVGDVIVKGNQSLKEAELWNGVGNVEIKGEWNVEKSSIETEVGNVTFHKSVKADELSIDVDMGNIMVPAEVKANGNYSLSTGLGEIMATDGEEASGMESLILHILDQN